MPLRRRLLLLTAAVCVLVAVPFVWHRATTPAPGANVENFKRLRVGMSWEQAKAILGSADNQFPLSDGAICYVWKVGDEEMWVWEDTRRVENGCIMDEYGTDWKIVRTENLMETLRRWLGL